MQNKGTIVRIVLVALMAYALLHFAAARAELEQTRQLAGALTAEQESLEAENRRLTGLLEAGYDDGTMEAMARERLGLVMPGETVFYFTKDREVQSDGTGSWSGS